MVNMLKDIIFIIGCLLLIAAFFVVVWWLLDNLSGHPTRLWDVLTAIWTVFSALKF